MSVRIISDPVGNVVYLPPEYDLKNLGANLVNDDIGLVIKLPTFIITVNDLEPELYHYRSVRWNLTIMFKSEKEQNHWIVTDFIKNPDSELVKELLDRGKMVMFNN